MKATALRFRLVPEPAVVPAPVLVLASDPGQVRDLARVSEAGPAVARIVPEVASRARACFAMPRPQYTADAMRAKIQGRVEIECIVEPNRSMRADSRSCGSLDPVFGLDQEAIKAVRQWRFVPGRLKGKDVPVIITIELTFTLR